jgi:signal transduction histidine kinase
MASDTDDGVWPADEPAPPAGSDDLVPQPGRRVELDQLRAVTAGLAHEIRNPLRFVKNYAEVVSELADELRSIVAEDERIVEPTRGDLSTLHEELRQAADQIDRHVTRLDAVVESMSAASSPASGRRQLTDVNLLVRESAEFAYHGRAGSLAAPRIEGLAFDLDTNLPPALLDPVRLSRAVINLVTNALQALAGGQGVVRNPQVTVRTGVTDDGFAIAVEDNGPGMAPDIRSRVFEPFFTAKRGRHHAGLGLTQAWDIVTNHGGTITIDSEPEHGTVVTLRLPTSNREARAGT